MKKSLMAAFVIFSLLAMMASSASSERDCPCAKKEKVEPMTYHADRIVAFGTELFIVHFV